MALASTARPQAEPLLRMPRVSASPWLVLIVLALGEFMILLDTTIVNVALPSMATDLRSSGDQILWVVNAYTLTFAVLLIASGRVGAMVGSKRLFLAGLLLFTCASAACAAAQSPGELVAFRIVQAVGGAALTPQTLSIITSIFPAEKRGAAFGVWGAIYGLGGISGPTLGGLLTADFSWRAIFLPNLPIGIAAIVLAWAMMPELSVRSRHHLDLVGVALAAVGLFALIFGLVEGQTYAWGRMASVGAFDLGPIHAGLLSIPSVFLASALVLTVFVLWEARQEEPLLPLSLFQDRNYALGCIVSTIQVFGMTGLFLPFVIYLQTGLHMTALEAGLAVLPNALGAVAVAPLVGKFADRVNAKYLLIAGLSVYALGMGLIIELMSADASALTFAGPLAVVGLGTGLTFAPVTSLTMQSVAPSASGAASGFTNTVRQVGSALSAAIGGAILFGRVGPEAHNQAARSALQVPAQFRQAFGLALAQATSHLAAGGTVSLRLSAAIPAAVRGQMAALAHTVVSHAFTNATRPALMVPMAVGLVGAALTTFMRSPRRSVASEESAAEAAGQAKPAAGAPAPAFAPVLASETIALPAVPHQLQPMVPLRAIRPPFLVQIGDPSRAERAIKNTLVLGRQAGSDLVVQDPRVSRRHAEIASVDGACVVRDLNSANGTWVNDALVASDQRLHDGDVIRVGSTVFVYHDDREIARPRLVQTGGERRGVYFIRTSLSIGRLSGNDVVLEDRRVSRRHAQVALRDGGIYLRDLNSLNGTRVNGVLATGDHLLVNGDVIRLGEASFVYHNDLEATNAA